MKITLAHRGTNKDVAPHNTSHSMTQLKIGLPFVVEDKWNQRKRHQRSCIKNFNLQETIIAPRMIWYRDNPPFPLLIMRVSRTLGSRWLLPSSLVCIMLDSCPEQRSLLFLRTHSRVYEGQSATCARLPRKVIAYDKCGFQASTWQSLEVEATNPITKRNCIKPTYILYSHNSPMLLEIPWSEQNTRKFIRSDQILKRWREAQMEKLTSHE